MLKSLQKSRLLREVFRRRASKIALVMILLLYVVALAGPFLVAYSPTEQNLDAVYRSPSWVHPFGTDSLGRDMLSRILFAMRTTALISFSVLIFGGFGITVALGIISGYYGGKIDSIIMRSGEILSAIPTLYLVLLIAATLRPRYDDIIRGILGNSWFLKSGMADIVLIFGIISLFSWVVGVRVLRSRVLSLRELGYVEAAKSLGASDARIMFRHIFPNLMGLIVLSITSTMGFVIGTEIALSFLGFGVRPPHPSFGAMLFEFSSIRLIQNYPYLLIFPSIIVVAWIFSFALLRLTATDAAESKRS